MKHLYAATCSVALYLVVTLQTSSAAPIQTKEDAWKFLTEFGYVPEASDSQNVMDESTAFRKFLMEMQYMAGLNQTGELDEPTIATLNTPRCSVKDNVGFSNHARRRKRYAIEGSRWRNLQVSFGVTTFTNQLNQEAQKSTFRTAFQYWAQASGLSFRETTASTGNDIDIKFAKRAHGDASPFDGIGGVLAHAYFPSSGGDTHFDDDEQWTLNTNRGTNLLQVATHEFGHSLGLGHSNVPGSIMYAYYNGYTPNLQLTPDDIAGIQYLYGPPPSGTGNAATTSTRSTTTRPRAPVVTTLPRAISTTYRFTSGSRPAICNYPKVDAIVVVDGVTYAFSDSYYYELNDQGITPGYPKTIVSKWSQINGQVDAALYYEPVTTSDQYGRTVITKPGYLFLFQGSRYWKYQNVDTLESGYPRQIREGFPGIPDNIDAAFIWSGNGRVYFMKGSNYYRYSPMIGTDAGYPRTISSAWGGLPSSGITAAFKWTNSRTYFFVGTQYYRLNDVTISVDSGYPRNTGEWWFGCSSLGGNLKVEDDDERNGFIEIENSNTTAPSRLIISGNGDSGNGGAGAPSHLANIHAICVLLITLFVRAAISSNLFVAELELKSV